VAHRERYAVKRPGRLEAKVASLPEARWRKNPHYILFALGGFSPELVQLAADPAERLYLVAELDMLGWPSVS